MRHNFAKYQKRRAIREELGRRLDAARATGSQPEYARLVEAYTAVRDKISRHYPWRFKFTGRMC